MPVSLFIYLSPNSCLSGSHKLKPVYKTFPCESLLCVKGGGNRKVDGGIVLKNKVTIV